MLRALQSLQRRPDRALLLAFGIAAALLLLVLHLASEVGAGDTNAFDAMILRAIRNAADRPGAGFHALYKAMLDFTALGDVTTLTLVVALVAGALLIARKAAMAGFLIAASLLGTFAVETLKSVFDRPRPNVVAHWATFSNTSFPSGHAADSAIVYLTLAALVARSVESSGLRVYVLLAAMALTLLIGLSRLYLGVHWPTDVLAGWILGASWAFLAATIAWWLQARNTLEQPGD
ncbi:phosphatase PAP2 family protein [Sphingomonas sp. CARO-RG-8B-R24-01]|nr:phosphatase PAP2 family protein [Sphingomonas sp. CARO-RG-8B-R24-01]